VRLLLDTHALLWFYLGDSQLSRPAQDSIIDPNNIKLISPASYWEIAIKLSIQKYTLQVSYDEFIQEAVFDNGFEILPIEPRHTAALISLTFHHKDPFDRMLIAQPTVEGIPIVSVDSKFDPYPITRLW
jgi:PIN domain nuclease of toxin-antitoxin system